MSFFKTDDPEMFNKHLGGYGKRDRAPNNSEIPPEAAIPDDYAAQQALETTWQATRLLPIQMTDELISLARDIRLMPGTLSARFQQELLDVIPKWMPARSLFARRIWQTLFVWSLKKWEDQNSPPISSISMERLSEAIMSNGSANLPTNNPPQG